MMALAADKLRHLGAGVTSVDLGSQQVPGDLLLAQELPLPWPSAMPFLGGVKKKGLTQLSPQSPEPRFPIGIEHPV